MKKLLVLALILPLVLSCSAVFGQTDKQTAHDKGMKAIQLEDEGKLDEALNLLGESHKLDPGNSAYPYESTYIYYSQKLYAKVIAILDTLKDKPDSFDRLYELLGNSYDENGQGAKAVAIYEEGLKKFPKSGPLYLERGVMSYGDKKYNEALGYFEKGLEVDPKFPSNYYWAAKLFCNSEDPMWGLIYGEIFINLERNSTRTQEISKLLYDTYKSHIKFDGNKTTSTLSKNAVINVNGDDKIKLPYSTIYEPSVLLALGAEKQIDLNSLDRIRQRFVPFYMEKFQKDYPNSLFAYQDKVLKAGHMAAYNHWLLMEGDENAFDAWQAANKSKWNNFIKWFTDNQMTPDDSDHFYRAQY
jgi:tetratricopeptide (TPR) repeat protein